MNKWSMTMLCVDVWAVCTSNVLPKFVENASSTSSNFGFSPIPNFYKLEIEGKKWKERIFL